MRENVASLVFVAGLLLSMILVAGCSTGRGNGYGGGISAGIEVSAGFSTASDDGYRGCGHNYRCYDGNNGYWYNCGNGY
jgi:hypothetical protein